MPAVVRRCRSFVCLFLLAICLGTSGCNVLGGREKPADTVSGLLADARIALTKGETEQAVSLLERAYRLDSTHVGVRIELSNALFADRGYDVFAVRSALMSFTDGATKDSSAAGNTVCSGGLDPERVRKTYGVVPIRRSEGIQTVVEHETVVHRVRDLLLRGVFEARSETLNEQADGSRMKAYLLAVLARVGREIHTVVRDVNATESTVYYDNGAPEGRFVVCGSNSDAVARVNASLCAFQSGLEQSGTWLQQRNELAGSEGDAVLLEPMRRQLQALRASFGCST